jgi:dienelactone hydrolase
MKSNFYSVVIILIIITSGAFSQTDSNFIILEDGGTGPYRAIITGEASLPGHTVYRPQDLTLAANAGKLPVILFGNGGCANSSAGHQNYLNEIASNGYIVIAIGPFTGGERNMEAMKQPTRSEQLLEALDWITIRNKDKKSPYFKKINIKKVAAMGQSCGGLQAIEVSGDPRITTTVVLNSGVLNSPPPTRMPGLPLLKKDELEKFHGPVIYIIGDSADIAFPNAMDDFSRIKNVPVVMANLKVGHGGTYLQPHGGAFAPVTLNWLDWYLKGRKENAKLFLGQNCGLCNYQGWRIETKNFK